jgi:hypothetical protein
VSGFGGGERRKGRLAQTVHTVSVWYKAHVSVYGSTCGWVVKYTYLLGLSEHLDLQVLPHAGRLDDALRILHLVYDNPDTFSDTLALMTKIFEF